MCKRTLFTCPHIQNQHLSVLLKQHWGKGAHVLYTPAAGKIFQQLRYITMLGSAFKKHSSLGAIAAIRIHEETPSRTTPSLLEAGSPVMMCLPTCYASVTSMHVYTGEKQRAFHETPRDHTPLTRIFLSLQVSIHCLQQAL